MTKIVVSPSVALRKSGKAKPPYRLVRDENGRRRREYRLDLTSPEFGDQFTAAFQSAVTKARKENKEVTGKADFEPGSR